ncbi:MAG TPA: phytoene/squalene synthase family protein [Stellaceae bacterium]|nr:phytoene/squalene synthase family protein [Stellaceae bacterium]
MAPEHRERGLDPLAQTLRRHDRDRYLTTLFAPADRRRALLALYAFNFEVAKIREITHEPLLGQMRLQWWREEIDGIYAGTVRRHEVAVPLAEAIRGFALTRGHFERILEARGADMEDAPPESIAALEAYAEDTSGRLAQLALEILGSREAGAQEAARHVGVAWALVGTLRALPIQARMHRSLLPRDLTQESGLKERELWELRSTPALERVVRRVGDIARDRLAAARRLRAAVPRGAIPALLVAPLADLHLRRLAQAGYNPFDPLLVRPDALAGWRLAFAALRSRF